MKHDERRGGVRRNTTKSAGFTLIELVVVIVILGVLAAAALPRFVNLSGDARAAVIKSLEGSMRSANTMIYARASTENKLGPTGNAEIGGKTVYTQYGFAPNLEHLIKVLDYSPEIFPVNNSWFQHNGAPTPADCSVTYTGATATDGPKYDAKTSGC